MAIAHLFVSSSFLYQMRFNVVTGTTFVYTPELIEDQTGVNLAGPLVVVGDDAADEVGVGVPQGHHELGELFLVELAHHTEHSLSCACAELAVSHSLLGHTDDLS